MAGTSAVLYAVHSAPGADMWSLLVSMVLAAPPALNLTDDELARLRAGEVVVRAVVGKDGADSTGIALVHAEDPAIWAAVYDFEARIPETRDLKAVAEVDRKSRWEWTTRFSVGMLGLGGDIHLRYTWHEAERWCAFSLDPAYQNYLEAGEGWYLLRDLDDGVLLAYYMRSRASFYAPQWLQRMLATDSMEVIMERLRARSENPP